MQQATVNLFADMGVQPAHAPVRHGRRHRVDRHHGADGDHHLACGRPTFTNGTQVTITGTATDVGGRVGGVEVSIDGGTTLASGQRAYVVDLRLHPEHDRRPRR